MTVNSPLPEGRIMGNYWTTILPYQPLNHEGKQINNSVYSQMAAELKILQNRKTWK